MQIGDFNIAVPSAFTSEDLTRLMCVEFDITPLSIISEQRMSNKHSEWTNKMGNFVNKKRNWKIKNIFD